MTFTLNGSHLTIDLADPAHRDVCLALLGALAFPSAEDAATRAIVREIHKHTPERVIVACDGMREVVLWSEGSPWLADEVSHHDVERPFFVEDAAPGVWWVEGRMNSRGGTAWEEYESWFEARVQRPIGAQEFYTLTTDPLRFRIEDVLNGRDFHVTACEAGLLAALQAATPDAIVSASPLTE